MSGQKTILSFFQKQTPTKRLLECTTNKPSSPGSATKSKSPSKNSPEKDEINEKSLSVKRLKLDDENSKDSIEPVNNENKKEEITEVTKEVQIDDKARERMEENKYAAKLKLVQKQTFGLVNNFGISWFKALEPEFSKPYFVKLAEFVAEERKKFTIFPPEHQVFSWTILCKIDDVKVVVIGQDPYPGPNQAHGLCFSVRKNIATPPSLINIYKELNTDIEGFVIPKHGTLVGWASQGVLLLNACLTVRKGEANSHKDKGWETFIDQVIRTVNSRLRNVVFMLWGAFAQKKAILIDTKKHLILNAPHPSPLSASKGWFGTKHFSKANKYLEENGKNQIDWKYLPTEDEFEEIMKQKTATK